MRRARDENLPLIAYIHPWEIDPEQPRLSGRLKSRLRHYTNLRKTVGRLRQLFKMVSLTNFRDSRLAAHAPMIPKITKG